MRDTDRKKLKKFAEKLSAIRKQKGLSIRELASRCDVDHSKIVKLENHKANLFLTTLFELAEGLGVHPRDLLDVEFE